MPKAHQSLYQLVRALVVLVVLLLFVHMQKAYLVSVGLYWQM